MISTNPYPVIAVAGNGTIAIGLAALACRKSEVIMLVRSAEAAERAQRALERACSRVEASDHGRVAVTDRIDDLEPAGLVVEAVVEDPEIKAGLFRRIGAVTDADLATTTSSLHVGDLAKKAGQADRLFGLHVFNPVPVMKLIELCLPDSLAEGIAGRAHAWCELHGKTGIEVEDTAGFAVNRLLFPYLFDAVRYHERTGMEPRDVDVCMTLGVAHPMGPLALLDLVGLDVASAIGRTLYEESGNPEHLAPETVDSLIAAGHLGRKTGRGFFSYD